MGKNDTGHDGNHGQEELRCILEGLVVFVDMFTGNIWVSCVHTPGAAYFAPALSCLFLVCPCAPFVDIFASR